MKRFFLFFCLLIILVFLADILKNKYLLFSNSISKDIDENDKKKLSDFFRYYVINDSWGYVFLSSKPMSFSSLKKNNKTQNDGWIIWKKYKAQFEKNFIFLEKQNKFDPNFLDIIVVNKKEFMKIANEIKEIIFSSQNLSEFVFSILEDDELLGIFLGYGKNNSKKYVLTKFQNDKEKKLNFFINYMDRLKLFIKHFRLFRNNIHFITLPNFMVDLDSLETKCLKNKYQQSRKEIISHYKNKNFLDGTLELLLKEPID